MRKLFLLLVSIILPLGASAGERGFYLDVSFGSSTAESSDFLNSTAGTTTKVNYENGYNFSSALGYMPQTQRGVLYHLRFEAEAAIRTNHLSKVAGAEVNNGHVQVASFMANALYDLRNSSQVTPYIGGGLGVANVRLNKSTELGFDNSESDMLGAFQLMTGITFEPSMNSSSALHLGYRYFGTLDDITLQLSNTAQDVSTDYRAHIIEGGLRVDF